MPRRVATSLGVSGPSDRFKSAMTSLRVLTGSSFGDRDDQAEGEQVAAPTACGTGAGPPPASGVLDTVDETIPTNMGVDGLAVDLGDDDPAFDEVAPALVERALTGHRASSRNCG